MRAISTAKKRRLEPSLASRFLERTRFPHNLTACYEVLGGPEWPPRTGPTGRPEGANNLALC